MTQAEAALRAARPGPGGAAAANTLQQQPPPPPPPPPCATPHQLHAFALQQQQFLQFQQQQAQALQQQAQQQQLLLQPLQLRLLVPATLCGALIGRGGSTIRAFSEDARASIAVSAPDSSPPGVPDRVVDRKSVV